MRVAMHAKSDAYQGIVSRIDLSINRLETPKEDIQKHQKETWEDMKAQGRG